MVFIIQNGRFTLKFNLDKTKLKQRLFLIGLILFFGYISVAFSADLNDINATQNELTKFNEKYLKDKLHTDGTNTDVAKIVKMSDIAKQKSDVNVTMQKIDTSQNREIFKQKDSKEASTIDSLVGDKAFIDKVKDNKKFILENYKIGEHKMEVSPETQKEITTAVSTTNNGKEKIFIVISSSMPKEQIREYFKAVEGKENITFILRGLVGDLKKFDPTRQYLESIIKKYPNDKDSQDVFSVAVEINPKITKKYNINKVPAIIYVKNYDGQADKSEPLMQTDGEEFWISYGLASFDYIVEQINKEAKSSWLDELLKKDTFFNPKEKKQ